MMSRRNGAPERGIPQQAGGANNVRIQSGDQSKRQPTVSREMAGGRDEFCAGCTAGHRCRVLWIVESIGRKPHAFLDVAVDTRTGVGVNVEFRMYDEQGTQQSQFFVPTNAYGLASTELFGNLFDLPAGQPMLIRAITAQSTVLSGATLGVTTARGPSVTLGVLPEKKLDGTLLAPGRLFSIALSSFRSARLLIGNVSGSDTTVDVFRGTEGLPGTGIYSIPTLPNFGHKRIDLTQNEALSNVVVLTSGLVIVQLVIDDGKTLHSHMVPPGA
jgi:hypothetical protein